MMQSARNPVSAAELTAREAATPITPRQARLAMAATPHGQGTLLQAVQSAIVASDNPGLQIAWEYAVEWKRDAPEIAQIGAALGLTAAQIDTLFVRAKAV